MRRKTEGGTGEGRVHKFLLTPADPGLLSMSESLKLVPVLSDLKHPSTLFQPEGWSKTGSKDAGSSKSKSYV